MGVSYLWRLRKRPKLAKKMEESINLLAEALGITGNRELNVIICGDALLRKLNRDFRGNDEVTDVLSFPMDSVENLLERKGPTGIRLKRGKDALVLGDVVVDFRQVERQAVRNGNRCADEFFAVTTHGILHLLGFDHREKRGWSEMTNIEKKIHGIFQVEVENFGH